MFIFNVAQRPC